MGSEAWGRESRNQRIILLSRTAVASKSVIESVVGRYNKTILLEFGFENARGVNVRVPVVRVVVACQLFPLVFWSLGEEDGSDAVFNDKRSAAH